MRDVRTGLVLADGDERWAWELQGEPLVHRVHRVHRTLEGFFNQVLVVASDPSRFEEMGFRAVADAHPEAGPLGAIATGLRHVGSRFAFVAGADAPFLHPRVVRHLYEQRKGWDVVVPKSHRGFEPLCAVYSSDCAAPMENRIRSGSFKVLDFISGARTRIVNGADLEVLDPSGVTFRHVHSQAELDVLWVLQVILVGVGHVYSLWAAQKISRRAFDDPAAARRGQLPILAGMIAFSIFSLWLLKQPMEMRTSAM